VTAAEDPAAGSPLVTVSLVTWQGLRWLPGCLDSLAGQRLAEFELLVLDNASTDGSRAWLEDRARDDGRIRLSVADRNLGFAAGHNRNIARARGEHVLLLNQDVELDPGFLLAAVSALRRDPRIGSVQGRLRRLGGPGLRLDVLDTTGLLMGRDRRAVSRAQGEPDGPAHARAGPVWGVDGPAPVYRRAALEDARVPRRDGTWEVLDEDFFLYKEDVDLAWRLRLLGWRAWYEPSALAWHARGTGGTGATSLLGIARTNQAIPRSVKAISWRNQRLMQVKNETPAGYLRDLPWIATREVLSLAFILLLDPRRFAVVPDLLRALPGAARKRRYLQARVRAAASAIAAPNAPDAPAARPRLRRRLYDALPDPLRAAARAGLRATRSATAGHSRRTVTRSVRSLVPGRDRSPARPGLVGGPLVPSVLFVDEAVPEHDVHAGALTVRRYLALLAREGVRVVYRPHDGLAREPYTSELGALGVEVLVGALDVADWLAVNGRGLDAVVLARPNLAPRYLPHVRRRSDARVLYLAHDLAHLRERRRHEATGDAEALRESRRLLEIERELFGAVDVVLVFSADEVPVVRRLAPGADVRVVTPAFTPVGAADEDRARPPLRERRDVMFLGAFHHPPNVDAATVLVREVMPRAWERVPDARVLLVGAHAGPEVARLAGERVEVTGHVPDLGVAWRRARMTVSPLRFGAGVKGKVIASLEAGVPVVTTPIGNEGIGLAHGREALIGSSPDELAGHVVRLFEDPDLLEPLAREGRRVVEERFSEQRARDDLLAALGIAPRVAPGRASGEAAWPRWPADG
jgi:GT2 family glycosyltransferase/glycosyltransferase involved in cell wall biosynthesis